ncbi:hypothetical protein THAOC_07940, partial [Thalassiosira oceanica]
MGGSCGDSHLNQHWSPRGPRLAGRRRPPLRVDRCSSTVPRGATHEELIRWTQMLPKQPPVHVFNTGERADGGGLPSLVGRYARQGYNAFYMKRGLANGGHDYESERAVGLDRFGWGVVGDGYHNTTRYEEDETEDRRESLGVLMRNWHPGPLGFQLTSDAFTYVYTKAVLKALDLIEDETRRGNDPEVRWSGSRRPDPDLPDPELCDPSYCLVDRPPSCAVYELPSYGDGGVRAVGPDEPDNPLAGSGVPQTWSPWRPSDRDPWSSVGKADAAVFRGRDDRSACPHDDMCAAMMGGYEDGAVVFRLPELVAGLVVICLCCGKEAAAPAYEYPYLE